MIRRPSPHEVQAPRSRGRRRRASSSVMAVVVDTPPDATHTSLSHLATNQLPICIPWTLGTGFLGNSFSSAAATSHNPFAVPSAFSPESLAKCRLELCTADGASGGEYRRISTSGASQSTEHMDVSVSVSVGCDFLGASGSGTYVKNVLQNHDVSPSTTDVFTR